MTTHDWSDPVDVDHVASVRRRADLCPDGTHAVLEVLAYALDEAAEGTTRSIDVVLHADGSVEVVDDGRGTDTRPDEHGVLHVKPVMATRDLRFFDAEDPPRLADGRPRRGMSVVTAASSRLVHENRRADGVGFRAEYAAGLPVSVEPLERFEGTGTSVRWWGASASDALERCIGLAAVGSVASVRVRRG